MIDLGHVVLAELFDGRRVEAAILIDGDDVPGAVLGDHGQVFPTQLGDVSLLAGALLDQVCLVAITFLRDAGIVEISIPKGKTQRLADFDGRGNDLDRLPGAVFKRSDGSTGAFVDVWFQFRERPARMSAKAGPRR